MSSPYIQPSNLMASSESSVKFSWATASALEYCNRRDPTSTVCPGLTKKLGEQMIRQPSIGWWERGEAQTDISVGESAMWRRDVNEKKFYTTCQEDTENRPYIILRLISEYGSTRDKGGWTRQMVMYEENTPSPYPFKHDCFTEENERYRRGLEQNDMPGLIHSDDESEEKMPGLIYEVDNLDSEDDMPGLIPA